MWPWLQVHSVMKCDGCPGRPAPSTHSASGQGWLLWGYWLRVLSLYWAGLHAVWPSYLGALGSVLLDLQLFLRGICMEQTPVEASWHGWHVALLARWSSEALWTARAKDQDNKEDLSRKGSLHLCEK